MRTVWLICVSMLLAGRITAQVYELPISRWPEKGTLNAAVRVYWTTWEYNIQDSVIPCYYQQAFNVRTNWVTYNIRIDSITGRGQARRVKIHTTWPDTNRIWCEHYDEPIGDSIRTSDSSYWWPDSLCRKIIPSPDSLSHHLIWLRPEGYQGHGRTSFRDDSSMTRLSLWQVIGDPYAYEGRNQRALFKITRVGFIPDTMMQYVDTYP